MNPLRTQHNIELEGRVLPLRFELFDWARAEQDLGLKLLPFGETEFWQNAGLAQNAALLYVGIKRAWPEITLDKIYDLVTWENHGAIAEVLQVALTDFFRRLRPEAPEEKPAESSTALTGTNSELSGVSISASASESSGG